MHHLINRNHCDEDNPNLCQVLEDEVESYPASEHFTDKDAPAAFKDQHSEKECAHPWRCLNNIACSMKDAAGPCKEKPREAARGQEKSHPSVAYSSQQPASTTQKLHQLYKSKKMA